jgi:hypothetical protein
VRIGRKNHRGRSCAVSMAITMAGAIGTIGETRQPIHSQAPGLAV